MKFSDVMHAPVNCSRHASNILLFEISKKSTWISYTSAKTPKFNELMDDFLSKHARIPDRYVGSIPATKPMASIRTEDSQGNTYRGGIFLNGAVVCILQENKSGETLLFVEKALAQRLNYPPSDDM